MLREGGCSEEPPLLGMSPRRPFLFLWTELKHQDEHREGASVSIHALCWPAPCHLAGCTCQYSKYLASSRVSQSCMRCQYSGKYLAKGNLYACAAGLLRYVYVWQCPFKSSPNAPLKVVLMHHFLLSSPLPFSKASSPTNPSFHPLSINFLVVSLCTVVHSHHQWTTTASLQRKSEALPCLGFI